MNSRKPDLKNRPIIVLDDNETTRLTLKDLFEKEGATVYSSGHIERGSSILAGLISKQQYPALIITDIRLPGTYGFEVLRRIQDVLAGQKAPVLLISRGLSDFALRRTSLYGVVGYARKPLLIHEIFEFSNEIIAAFDAEKLKAIRTVTFKTRAA